MNELDLALQYRREGNLEESKSIILDLLSRDPSNPVLLFNYACAHDVMGLEREAIPYYIKSLDSGLTNELRKEALLGLGSSYRALGMYDEANEILEKAIQEFPDGREMQVFYAMVQYNLQKYGKAMEILLNQIIDTSSDDGIQAYKKAIKYYSDKLDQVWD